MRISCCQLRPTLGDIEGNVDRAIDAIHELDASVICFSELFLIGYPPTDEWLRNHPKKRIERAISKLKKASEGRDSLIVMGTPFWTDGGWKNAAIAISNGSILHCYFKCCLPNYDVFNDSRYFSPGDTVGGFEWQGKTIALLICEDIWASDRPYGIDPVRQLNGMGVDLIVHIAASPYEQGKMAERQQRLTRVVNETGATVASVNQVGGYADIIFDGQSMVMGPNGEFARYPAFKECLVDTVESAEPCPPLQELTMAIVYGIREYVTRTNGPGGEVLLGISGGIDSAVVAALAVHALGCDRVTLVALPTKYNGEDTKADAKELARRLGANYINCPIDDLRVALDAHLNDHVGPPSELTKQNVQARLRGLMLMAVSNQRGALLLTTGNKSELAMGYATLYGDMCGALNPIGDVFKTDVVELANHMNDNTNWIPHRIINRAPSAELAYNQHDEDTLPPYPILDAILRQVMIHNATDHELYKMNDKSDVDFVLNRLKINEFKRFQSPPIIKVSGQSFGRGWQHPLIR